MKWGLYSKLIVSFVLVITIPLLVTAAGLLVSITSIVEDEDLKSILHINEQLTTIVSRIEKQYVYINNYDAFNHGIQPLITQYNGQVIIVDNNGYLLFDSLDKQASQERQQVGLDIITNFDDNSAQRYPRINKYSFAVVIDNKSVANTIIILDIQAAINKVLLQTIYHVGGSFFLGFMALLSLVILFSFLISRSILVPIKELYGAVDRIAQGDVDFKIHYTKDNELGKLCKAFNLMSSRLKESLEQQAKEVKSRKELIAGISHDLRTPIASIRGYVEGLQDGIVQDKKMFDRYLSVIKDKSTKLDHLIDDLFQFSQLELGELKMDMEIHDSAQMLLSIFKEYDLDFKPDINFSVIEPLPSVEVMVDSRRISQVLDNILQNAKRFVPKSGNITAGAVVEGNFIKVYIKDNGCGIAEADMPFIFNRFYRGEKSRSRDYGGTGLGLAICYQIITDHRGEIWADSTQGQGTTFFFTLPIYRSENLIKGEE